MKFFPTKSKPLMGIDIGTHAVRLVQMTCRNGHYRLSSYASELLPIGAVVDGNVVDADIVSDAIKQAMMRMAGRSKQAAIAVSGASTIIKIITMSADLDENELESQVEVEASQYIPYPIEEVSIDFSIIGPAPKALNKNHILLAAARTETVDSRIVALELAGLEAKVVDVESFARENACQLLTTHDHNSSDAIGLVELGDKAIYLSVLEQGRTIYTREQGFGSDKLDDAIMDAYGIPFQEAVSARMTGKPALPEDYQERVLLPFREALVQQIGRLFQLFYAVKPHTRLQHVILSGECATLPGLVDKVGDHLNSACQIADPIAAVSDGLEKSPTDAPAWMIAAGLAMRVEK